MGKNLGNIVFIGNGKKLIAFIAVFFCSQIYAASISLQIFDAQGNELESVGVGQPFVLKVSMEGFKKRVSRPVIPHLERIQGENAGEGHTSQSRNGQVSMHTYFSYVGRIDKEGSYLIGPVRQENEGVVVTSPELTIAAHQDMKMRNTSHKKKQDKVVVFANFTVDHDKVVVGQALRCAVRFYYSDNSGVSGDAQLSLPTLPGFVVGEAKNTGRGRETMQGVSCQFIEWQWNMYPQEAGVRMIPALAVDFVVNVVSQRSLLRLMFQEVRQEVSRVHSNVVHLTVHSLPPHDTKVVGIGTFTDLKTVLHPLGIKEGEAALLTVEIQGQGNSEIIDQFTLVGMPDAVKYYESKKYMGTVESEKASGGSSSDVGKKDGAGRSTFHDTSEESRASSPGHVDAKSSAEKVIPKKCFEFVIQGLRAGEWQIPEQQFTYFDTDAYEYKTVRSAAITFRITPGQAGVQPPVEVVDDPAEQEIIAKDEAGLHHLALNKSAPWHAIKEKKALPLWLFVCALLIPLFVLVCYLSLGLIRSYYGKHERVLQSRRAATEARLVLKKYQKDNKVNELYALCMRYVAQRLMIPEATVSRSLIKNRLEQKQCPVQELEKSEQLLDELARYAFAHTHVQYIGNDIYRQVEQWIVWLEKKI